jgi:hypothetical protein
MSTVLDVMLISSFMSMMSAAADDHGRAPVGRSDRRRGHDRVAPEAVEASAVDPGDTSSGTDGDHDTSDYGND